MQRFHDVARIVATKGLDGRVVLDCTHTSLFEELFDSPGSNELGLTLHFVPPKLDCPRSGRIEQIVSIDGNRVVALVAGIGSVGSATDLVGCHCLASHDDVERLGIQLDPSSFGLGLSELGISADSIDPQDGSDPLVGWSLVDKTSGFEGRVVGVECPAGQVLLEVSGASDDGGIASNAGSERTHLVPLAAELVCDVDEAARSIAMRLPEGIFDL